MKIRLLTITHKSPSWIQEGYDEYIKRLSSTCTFELIEIPALKRTTQSDINRILRQESQKMLSLINRDHYVIALDIKGKMWTTEELAARLENWQLAKPSLDLLIGGPEGLSTECLNEAHEKWSLSRLTFPHILVKVIIAEQIYRAFSIIKGHPYHR